MCIENNQKKAFRRRVKKMPWIGSSLLAQERRRSTSDWVWASGPFWDWNSIRGRRGCIVGERQAREGNGRFERIFEGNEHHDREGVKGRAIFRNAVKRESLFSDLVR